MKEGAVLTCSAFNVSSIKICCNFSLTKLIQNCSKPFFWEKKKMKKLLPLIVSAKSFWSHFLSDLVRCFHVKSLNRNVGGIRRKLHSLYLGETNLVKAHKNSQRRKLDHSEGFFHCLELVYFLKPEEMDHLPQSPVIQTGPTWNISKP